MKHQQINWVESLINWYEKAQRRLPWREDKNPYKVWLSEIILQQTRVAQGLPYYEKFVKNFPTVFDLAGASTQEVLSLWEGLGYYSRARNLHTCAKQVVEEFNGEFPTNFKDLQKLKGIGSYTAAAIASICFNEKVPVVDGNVFRVISRLFGIDTDIHKSSTKRQFFDLLQPEMPNHHSSEFNQAMMEIGALVCKPRNPECGFCPVREYCHAFTTKTQHFYPVNNKKVKIRIRWFHYLILYSSESIAMKKRGSNDIWSEMYDFHLIETDQDTEIDWANLGITVDRIIGPVQHILTHQKIGARFYLVSIDRELLLQKIANNLKLSLYSFDEVVNLPKPKLIVNVLSQLNNSVIL